MLIIVNKEWKYVGESGEVIPERCNHSFSIVTSNEVNYLVVFGGCNEQGTCSNDTYYAALPTSMSAIGM